MPFEHSLAEIEASLDRGLRWYYSLLDKGQAEAANRVFAQWEQLLERYRQQCEAEGAVYPANPWTMDQGAA